jgi:hypothetical protein
VTSLFDDPQPVYHTPPTGTTRAVAITGAGSAKYDFVCTGRGPTSSTYRYTVSSTHWIDLFIGRQIGKRNRYTVRLTERELVTDPIDTTINSVKTSSIFVIGDVGVLGVGTNWDKMCHMLAANYLFDATDDQVWFNAVVNGET